MDTAADVALLCLAVMASIFAGIYIFRSPWWKNRIGKVYALKNIIMVAVLIQISASVWISDDYMFRQPIRLFIYAAGALVHIPMIVTLLREQSKDRRR